MKLYINEQMVLPVLGRLELRKTCSEAAATLTATLYTAAADTYFQHLSLAVGDVVRLLDEGGEEIFLGSIHTLRRTPEQVELVAYDRGIYLTRNELRGVFCGTPEQIVAQVARLLDLPTGTVETEGGWKSVSATGGMSAFAILRQAVGQKREIALRDGKLTVTKSGYMVYVPEPSHVVEAEGAVSMQEMVDRCEVVDRKGRLLATAENAADMARYGRFQAVLRKDGKEPALQAKNALRGPEKAGEVVVLGNLHYRCGCALELHRPDWGLDGVYAVTGAVHRWEGGIYTTTMELELIRA